MGPIISNVFGSPSLEERPDATTLNVAGYTSTIFASLGTASSQKKISAIQAGSSLDRIGAVVGNILSHPNGKTD